MGSFHTDATIENTLNRAKSTTVPKMLVDAGSEFTWVAAPVLEQLNITRENKNVTFLMANGQSVTRNVGFAIVRVGGSYTVDEVVFGEPGDLSLLGARSMEGLNLTVDPVRRKLVASGPLPAATPRRTRPASRKSKKRK